jgi:hypothetical protein
MLVRLMYASRAAEAANAETLAAILKTSKEHNPKVGVTGVLCFCANARSSCRFSKAAATPSARSTTTSRRTRAITTSPC